MTANGDDSDNKDEEDNFLDDGSSEEESSLSLEAFQQQVQQRQQQQQEEDDDDDEVFDGYALRDIIQEKWGKCYDVDFNRVDSFGFKGLYLNVLPFHLGGRRFRHASELDYLCHLQAVVEILDKYNQVCTYIYTKNLSSMVI